MSELPLAMPDGSSPPHTRAHATARSWKHFISPAGTIGVPVLLIGLLAGPMLFTYSSFAGDWATHLWLIWHQSLSIRANHFPTYFLNYSGGVFYPIYAFYGGTLYVLVGLLSLLLGNAPLHAYVLTYLLDFAAAYGGWYWIARSAGLGDWLAQAPGLLFITSPYYLTLIYERGDWPEFTAVSTIPLLIAAGLSVLRADRLRPLPALTLLGSSLIFFGSHNITTLWGSTVITLLALALLAFVPTARRQTTTHGLARVGAIAAIGLLLNAWYLLPDLAYEAHTLISSQYPGTRLVLQATMHLVSTKHIFDPSDGTAEGFHFSLPMWLLAWAFISGTILLYTDRGRMWMRVLLILMLITTGITVLMTHANLILALPRFYVMIQFTYRLESYVLLGLSGITLAILVLVKRSRELGRICTGALIPVIAIASFAAIQQINGHSHPRRFRSYLFSGPPLPDYTDIADEPVLGPTHLPVISFPPTEVRDDRVSVTAALQPGEVIETNLPGEQDLVHVSGATVDGLNPSGYTIMTVNAEPSGSSRHPALASERTISLRPADTLPVVLGRILSLIALIAVFALLGVLLIGRRRARTQLMTSKPPLCVSPTVDSRRH